MCWKWTRKLYYSSTSTVQVRVRYTKNRTILCCSVGMLHSIRTAASSMVLFYTMVPGISVRVWCRLVQAECPKRALVLPYNMRDNTPPRTNFEAEFLDNGESVNAGGHVYEATIFVLCALHVLRKSVPKFVPGGVLFGHTVCLYSYNRRPDWCT